MTVKAIRSESAQQSEAVGADCAELLKAGDVVLISGELGSGKTTFVRGACRALGVTEAVTSPTYVIGQIYNGSPEIAHLDLYRLSALGGEDPALLDDYLTSDRIAFIEWPEVAQDDIPRLRFRIEISFLSSSAREIAISGREPLP